MVCWGQALSTESMVIESRVPAKGSRIQREGVGRSRGRGPAKASSGKSQALHKVVPGGPRSGHGENDGQGEGLGELSGVRSQRHTRTIPRRVQRVKKGKTNQELWGQLRDGNLLLSELKGRPPIVCYVTRSSRTTSRHRSQWLFSSTKTEWTTNAKPRRVKIP